MPLYGGGSTNGRYAFSIFGGEDPNATVGTWVRLLSDGNVLYGMRCLSNPPALNNSITFAKRAFSGGTYTITFCTEQNNNQGIATIEISADGVNWTPLANIDTYAAGGNLLIADVTGLTIPAGDYFVRVRASGKNAASTNYFIAISAIHFMRTDA